MQILDSPQEEGGTTSEIRLMLFNMPAGGNYLQREAMRQP
jgi:hypothetical protein